MVGVRSRRGCTLCKKRKIKCDEAIPSCQKCVSRGKICPGYNIGFIFQDETSRLAKAYETSSRDSSREKSTSPPKELQASALQPPIVSRRDRLAGQLITAFYSAIPEGKRLDALAMYYLPFIPPRLGHNKALDDAVDCLTSAHQCLLVNQVEMPPEVYRKYGCALRSLKKAVEDPKVWTTNETLCATQLLTLFEATTSSVVTSYVLHADGTARLIEARGPNGFNDDFSHAMLASCRFSIWGSCVVQAKSLFLATEEWRQCMQPTEYECSMEEHSVAHSQLFAQMAAVPQLLSTFLTSFEDGFSLEDYNMLLHEAETQRAALLEAHADWNLLYGMEEYTWPTTVMSEMWDPNPTFRSFASYRIANIEVFYWTTLLIINRVIIYLTPHTTAWLVRQNLELAETICESVAFSRQAGPLKGVWISGSLSWALYEFRNDRAKRHWVTKSLIKIVLEWKFCSGEMKQPEVDTKLKHVLLALYTELDEGPRGQRIKYRADVEGWEDFSGLGAYDSSTDPPLLPLTTSQNLALRPSNLSNHSTSSSDGSLQIC